MKKVNVGKRDLTFLLLLVVSFILILFAILQESTSKLYIYIVFAVLILLVISILVKKFNIAYFEDDILTVRTLFKKTVISKNDITEVQKDIKRTGKSTNIIRPISHYELHISLVTGDVIKIYIVDEAFWDFLYAQLTV